MSEHKTALALEDIARIRAIVDCLVRHDKAGVDRLSDKSMNGDDDFWNALDEFEADFGHKFGPLPDDFQEGMRVYTLNSGSGWSVDQALWSEDGEMTDLYLTVDVIKDHPRNRIELYHLIVP